MNLSGVISPLILRYMVKKGTKKDAFYAKESDWRMLLPLPLMLLSIGVGLALLWFSRFQKTGKVFISVGWLALLLLSLQPVSDHLLRPIENRYPTWQVRKRWNILWFSAAAIPGTRSGRRALI